MKTWPRARAEAQVEAEGLIAAVSAALALDSDLLEPSALAHIQALISKLQTNLSSHTAEQIRAATTALAQATDDFAAKRMNRNIQRALTGQSVENL